MDFCTNGRLSSQRLISTLGGVLLLATQPACSTALDDDDSALPEPDAEHLFDFVNRIEEIANQDKIGETA